MRERISLEEAWALITAPLRPLGEEQVDLDLYAPDSILQHRSRVAEDLQQILQDHGLTGRSVQVRKSERPLAITDVFPDLFEGKRSVNVKV